jgi:hypothetical protein
MALTGETAGLRENPVGTLPLCTPHISHGRNVLGSNLELRGRRSGTGHLSCDIIIGSRVRDSNCVNPLTPNDTYRSRTAPLTSKRCILYIYSTIIGTEYFKRSIYSPFLPLQNAVCFIILKHLVPV